jgi:hypothetical protein
LICEKSAFLWVYEFEFWLKKKYSTNQKSQITKKIDHKYLVAIILLREKNKHTTNLATSIIAATAAVIELFPWLFLTSG